MGKRIMIALGLSLFYCLSVFGGEKETTYQEGACSLDTMAGIVDENEYGNENASISFFTFLSVSDSSIPGSCLSAIIYTGLLFLPGFT